MHTCQKKKSRRRLQRECGKLTAEVVDARVPAGNFRVAGTREGRQSCLIGLLAVADLAMGPASLTGSVRCVHGLLRARTHTSI